ncbi:ribosome-binding protein 1-like isoform X4 [Pomacea canaliculata]|uniref:ribosome-binding protein 1-like isoform X4 n=1 Tax=Pomacea canaliculata TaxID=400727 RepID=UPI000D72F2CA|nr:ribosome-binding protein 1-like isoform X4 [Pomacea canaliculata]
MDVQIILIGIPAFVVIAILIYLITAFAMREKTFEEVIAEQKRRQEEERERAKQGKKVEKEQYKKKFRKGKADKGKEKAAQVCGPEFKEPVMVEPEVTEHKMVNLEIDPEIIEPSDAVVLGGKSKVKPSRKSKPILVNKNEVTPVTEKATELPHKPITPRDEIELKKLHEKEVVPAVHVSTMQIETHQKKENKIVHQTENKQEVTETIKEVKEIKVQRVKAPRMESMIIQQNAPQEEGEKKISKIKNSSDTVAGGTRLVEMVRSASLSDKDVQTLTEILSNRQGTTGVAQDSWNKKNQKGDATALLKKQLEEKEKALQEEQQHSMVANNRVKEAKNELLAERSKFATMEKRYQEKVAQQASELEAMQQRMRHAHEQHIVEIGDMRGRLQQLEQSGDATLIQKLKQENKILQESWAKAAKESVPLTEVASLRQKVEIMQKELSSNALKLNSAENAKNNLEQKLQKAEEQMTKQESSKKVLEDKLDEVSAELNKIETKNVSLASDLKKATTALSQAETECSSLKCKLQELEKYLSSGDATKEIGAKLQEAERKKLDLEGNLKNLEKQLADALHHQNELNSELMQVRQENHLLTEEMRASKEQRQQAEGQEALSTAANGDIHKKVSKKDTIQLEEHERILSEKIAELAKLQQDLEMEQSAASVLKTTVENQLVQNKELLEQLDAQKQKNNELREKNWKAMEALEKAEKSASEKVDKTLKSSREATTKALADLESLDKGILQRLFPDISVSEKLGHKEWIGAFEKQAVQYIAKISSSAREQSEKIIHLQNENSQLQADLAVFRNNIAILHSEKDRVQELELENAKLKQQVETYEKSFAQVNVGQEKLSHLEEENKRLKENVMQNTSLSSEMSSLQEANRQLQSQVEEYKNIVSETEKKLQDLEHSVESEEKKWKEKLQQAQEDVERNIRIPTQEQELEELTIQQQAQLEDYRSVLSSTESTLRQLESRADAEEKRWQEKLQSVQKELEKSKTECHRLEKDIQKLHGSTEDLSDLGFAYRCVEKSLTSIVDEMQSRVEELEQQLQNLNDNLSAVTQEKQKMLSTIEELQQQLQNASESLSTITKENEKVKSKLEDVEKQLQNPSGTVEKEEAQSRLIDAKDQLKKSEERIVSLLREKVEVETRFNETNLRLKESEERISILSQEKEEIFSRVVVLEKQKLSVPPTDVEDLKRQLEELQQQLEAERKKNKDLSSTLVRLNGIIRTGQDALAQEQKLVKQLQDQLEEKTKGSDIPASQEIEQWRTTLKAKLNEKEKQLEREITANKQLSQRLNPSAGNDMGTSV